MCDKCVKKAKVLKRDLKEVFDVLSTVDKNNQAMPMVVKTLMDMYGTVDEYIFKEELNTILRDHGIKRP